MKEIEIKLEEVQQTYDKKNKSDIKYGDSYGEATVIAEKMKGPKS